MIYLILSIIIVIQFILLYIFYIKNNKAIQIIKYQDNFLLDIKKDINDTSKKLEEIDIKGSFKSDDEVGFFFIYLKEMQNNLNKYDIK
jgi:uncharacterized protein YoxC